MNLDSNKKYSAEYEFVHYVCTPQNMSIYPIEKRQVFTVNRSFDGYPHEIALSVKYYMGHYGALQGKLLGEANEITN